MINIIKRQIFLMIFTVSMSGCAGFQSNQISFISPDADTIVKPEIITYSISKDSTYGALGIFDDALISEMNRYGWKMRQKPDVKNGTPHLQIDLSLSKDPAAILPAVLTGLSFYTIPSWETSNYKLTANFLDTNGEEFYYEFRDKTVLVQWLPMLLAFPFAYPFSTEEELIKKMYNNLAYKISKDRTIVPQLTNQSTRTQ